MSSCELEKLIALADQAGIKEALCDILRAFNGARMRIDTKLIDRQDRPGFARQLIDAKTPRPQARERLMHRFGVSKRTAERDIQKALNSRMQPLQGLVEPRM